VDLDQWVSEGVPPPGNQVPRISDGTLVPPLPQSTRIVQRKRRPTSNVDSMTVLRARRGATGSK